jgi:tetratricopeptide (TPR) repeat protein
MTRRFVNGVACSLLAVLCLNCSAMAAKSMELRSANTYYGQDDKKQAQEWYEKAAAKNTGEAQVYARLVEIYADQKRWVEMNRAYQGFATCNDKPKDLEKYKADADRIIEQLWKGLWNGHVAHVKQADSCLAIGDSAGVRDHFRQARERMDSALLILPDRLDFLQRKGDLFIQEFNQLHTGATGQDVLRQAVGVYQGLVGAAPDSADFAVTLVQLQYNLRDYEGSRASVDRALERHPTHPDLLNYAGKVRIQQGLALKDEAGKAKLMGEAVGFLERAIALNPGDPMLVYNLGLLYRDMDKPQEALATFQRIEGMADVKEALRFDTYYSVAVLYFQGLPEEKQDAGKAAEYFQKCLDLQPDNTSLKFNLGVSLVRTGVKENIARGKALMTEGQ